VQRRLLPEQRRLPCSPTEALFVARSGDCYSCLVGAGCLDDAILGDTGHECGDLTGVAAAGADTGVSRSDLCLQTIQCILGSGCAAVDVANCYCGSLGPGNECTTSTDSAAPNGPCAATEVSALEHLSTDLPIAVLQDYFDLQLGGARANQIFACAASSCPTCVR
jgi:hypothetical protein